MSEIGYLSRQTSLRAEMGSTCPAVTETIWNSMGRATTWILENSKRIEHHLEEKQPSVTPQRFWWVLLAMVKCAMDLIDVCFKSIQGKERIDPEQTSTFQTLAENVKQLVNISPVNCGDLILLVESEAIVAQKLHYPNTFLVTEKSLTKFIEDFSMCPATDLHIPH